jgi:hypothetical protein
VISNLGWVGVCKEETPTLTLTHPPTNPHPPTHTHTHTPPTHTHTTHTHHPHFSFKEKVLRNLTTTSFHFIEKYGIYMLILCFETDLHNKRYLKYCFVTFRRLLNIQMKESHRCEATTTQSVTTIMVVIFIGWLVGTNGGRQLRALIDGSSNPWDSLPDILPYLSAHLIDAARKSISRYMDYKDRSLKKGSKLQNLKKKHKTISAP